MGFFAEFKKRIINRILDAELTTHLGYEKHQSPPKSAENGQPSEPNARNGHSNKTLRSDDGKLAIKVPRDRTGEFTPPYSSSNINAISTASPPPSSASMLSA